MAADARERREQQVERLLGAVALVLTLIAVGLATVAIRFARGKYVVRRSRLLLLLLALLLLLLLLLLRRCEGVPERRQQQRCQRRLVCSHLLLCRIHGRA